jgi:hypothetical protein
MYPFQEAHLSARVEKLWKRKFITYAKPWVLRAVLLRAQAYRIMNSIQRFCMAEIS